MEVQWPLLIFSVFLGITSGIFIFLGVGEIKGKFKDVRFMGALIALICLAIGGCVSVLHMG
ncbi:MAG: polysulfide reductase, partial [Raoultibacter sp.]